MKHKNSYALWVLLKAKRNSITTTKVLKFLFDFKEVCVHVWHGKRERFRHTEACREFGLLDQSWPERLARSRIETQHLWRWENKLPASKLPWPNWDRSSPKDPQAPDGSAFYLTNVDEDTDPLGNPVNEWIGKSISTFDVFRLVIGILFWRGKSCQKRYHWLFEVQHVELFFFATTALKKLSCGSTITKEKLVNTNALSVFRDQLTMISTTTMTKSALCWP